MDSFHKISVITHNGPIYNGICIHHDKWVMIISVNSKKSYIGTYDTEMDACDAYTSVSKDLKMSKNMGA